MSATNSKSYEIAGLQFQVMRCEKLNGELISSSNSIKEPLVHVTANQDDSYSINMVVFLPDTLKEIKPSVPSAFPIPIGKTEIYFKYNGIYWYKTPIHVANESQNIPCRDFELVYLAEEIKGFDVYSLEIKYSFIDSSRSLSAEAIMVRDENLDPRTSRGTITTTNDG